MGLPDQVALGEQPDGAEQRRRDQQCRDLLAQLRPVLDEAGVTLPLYWGNRNWHPLLTDTLVRMRDDGVRRALAFVTSPFGSSSSCRQYLDAIDAARDALGPEAPEVDKIRHFHDHPEETAAPALAERLGFTDRALQAYLEEGARRGLFSAAPQEGIRLTEEGMREASAVAERQRRWARWKTGE